MLAPPVWSLGFECYIFFSPPNLFLCLSGDNQVSLSKLVILRITDGNGHAHEPLRGDVNRGDILSLTALCFLNLWTSGTVGSFSTYVTRGI